MIRGRSQLTDQDLDIEATLGEIGIALLSFGSGSGEPYRETIGTLPAQIGRSSSSGSSNGGPSRILADADSIVTPSTEVAFSSCSFGSRTSCHRPASTFSEIERGLETSVHLRSTPLCRRGRLSDSSSSDGKLTEQVPTHRHELP